MSQFVAARPPAPAPAAPELAAPPAPAPSSKRLIPEEPALDGIRGIAVAAVLCFHAGFSWATGGFLGVSTFFTLSGFLITTLLLRERIVTGRLRLGAFWIRRFRRLMPAAVVALGFVVLYGFFAATPEQLETLRGDVLGALGYAANWRFLLSGQSYAQLFSDPSPVEHFWSLAIEEQFYLVYPLVVGGVVLLTRGRREVLGALLAVLAGISAWLTITLYDPADTSPRVLRHRHARRRAARRRVPGRAPRPEVSHRVAACCVPRSSHSDSRRWRSRSSSG